jgi:hypothetical protein
VIARCLISENTAGGAAGIGCDRASSPVIAGCIIVGNVARASSGGLGFGTWSEPLLYNNTIVGNTAGDRGGGICCNGRSIDLVNNVVVGNHAGESGGGMWCGIEVSEHAAHNNFWHNTPQDCYGCGAGSGSISADPRFAGPGYQDLHLLPTSPCIDAGDCDLPLRSYLDIDGGPRISDGDHDAQAVVDMGADEYLEEYEMTAAPGNWFVPQWVWFSIPLVPRGSDDASDLLGLQCMNRLFARADSPKTWLLYPDDFAGLVVGAGYLLRLEEGELYGPVYEGVQPPMPFGRLVRSAGWSWVGVPGVQDIHLADVAVEKGGLRRTQAADEHAAVPWLNWNWIFWDPVAQSAGIMDPFGSGDDEWLHPWYGYCVWVNVAGEGVTIIFP